MKKSSSKSEGAWASSSSSSREGGIPELRNYIFQFGSNQRSQYNHNVRAIGDYCGCTYSKEMQELVEDGIENMPEEPAKPKTKKTETDSWEVVKYEKELAEWIKDVKQYKKDKGRVFLVVKQQCSLAVCNKVEEQKEYKDIEKVSDVVGLLKIIKELMYNIRSVQYEHWVTTLAVRQLAVCKQGDKESLPNFYRRFKSFLEMGEA
jgi:hypothetical protein